MADKIKSWDDLKSLRQKAQLQAKGTSSEWVVAVGRGTCGAAAGADQVMKTITEGINKEKLNNVKVITTGCFGNCYAEPIVEVRRGDMPTGSGVRYGYVDEARAKEIVEKHLSKGEILNDAIVGQEVQIL